MKIRIEIDSCFEDDEVIIKCREFNSIVQHVHDAIVEKTSKTPNMVFYKDKDEYFFPLTNVLFFETDNETVFAHTVNDVYRTEYKLYELQQILPERFVRISKSTIVNITHILSVSRNLTSSSLIKFHKSHKQVYVSRFYYKDLKQKMLYGRSN